MNISWYAVIAICISTLALFVAAKNYRRKTGLLVRGSFTIASSRECDDRYVSSVILENIKDRTITIFAIYLRVGQNYYVQLEDFEGRPFLLKAYESYQKDFGPIQFYGINSNRMNLNDLLSDRKVKKRLVLSTSDGKYVVPTNIRHWSPVGDFFRNHMTAIVRPVHTLFKGQYIGSNIRYLIEFFDEKGIAEVVPIHPEDFRLKMFSKFSLTLESLESVASLTSFLEKQKMNGILTCKSFTVHDVHAMRQRAIEFYDGKTIDARYYTFLQYHVFGRLITRTSQKIMERENAKRRLTQTGVSK